VLTKKLTPCELLSFNILYGLLPIIPSDAHLVWIASFSPSLTELQHWINRLSESHAQAWERRINHSHVCWNSCWIQHTFWWITVLM